MSLQQQWHRTNTRLRALIFVDRRCRLTTCRTGSSWCCLLTKVKQVCDLMVNCSLIFFPLFFFFFLFLFFLLYFSFLFFLLVIFIYICKYFDSFINLSHSLFNIYAICVIKHNSTQKGVCGLQTTSQQTDASQNIRRKKSEKNHRNRNQPKLNSTTQFLCFSRQSTVVAPPLTC